jgi:DNA-binding transcriptional ArsR family regulator
MNVHLPCARCRGTGKVLSAPLTAALALFATKRHHTAREAADILGIDQTLANARLVKLTALGLIRAEREGFRNRYYRK